MQNNILDLVGFEEKVFEDEPIEPITLADLVARGLSDSILTENPKITYWKTTYYSHNYGIDTVPSNNNNKKEPTYLISKRRRY